MARSYIGRASAPIQSARDGDFAMSGMQGSSAGLDPRRRRILFRSWHRGTREMDLIMGRFADACLADLDERDLDALEQLLEAQDQDVFDWVVGQAATPPENDTDLMRKLQAFHHQA
jgi:antitoxin CptB